MSSTQAAAAPNTYDVVVRYTETNPDAAMDHAVEDLVEAPGVVAVEPNGEATEDWVLNLDYEGPYRVPLRVTLDPALDDAAAMAALREGLEEYLAVDLDELFECTRVD